MKGILYKSKEGWMVKYTTYKTIPGIKCVMGSHSRMPESNYLPVHPDTVLYPGGLWGQANVGEFETVDFEIVEIIAPVEDGTTMYKCANLINEEKHFKRRKQERAVTQDIVDEAMRIAGKDVRAPKCVRDMEDDNTYERQIWIDSYTQCQEDMVDAIKKQISDFQHDLRECTSTYIKENCEGAIFGLNRLLQSLKKQG